MAIIGYKWFFLLGSLLPAGAGTVADAGGAKPAAVSVKPHPVYVSVTEIQHNAAEKTLELSCKIFTDDFEKAIRNSFNRQVDLANPADKAEADKLVAEYVRKKLQVAADGKDCALVFVGFERERDVVWSYFQANGVTAAPKKIVVKNELLYESFPEQINIMHVTVSGKRQSCRVNNPESKAVFSF